MKRLYAIIVMLLLGAVLSGCTRTEPAVETKAGTYQVYYLNTSRTKLVPVEYETDTTAPETLIGELAGQMLAAPSDPDYQAILGEKVLLLDIKKDDNVLYLNFNKDYAAMKPTREILCRAALAKTFVQVDGIDYISINCDGQPLQDKSGSPVGAFSDSDFTDGITDVNAFERVKLTLYFANEKRDGLVAEEREVIHNINTPLEKLVLEQLLAGPVAQGNYPVLPKDTKLLNVSMSDNICYVNFDGRFTSGEPEAAEYITIYAVVNSLTELQTVSKVQIAVNGSANVVFRDAISLATPFERDTKHITGGDKS